MSKRLRRRMKSRPREISEATHVTVTEAGNCMTHAGRNPSFSKAGVRVHGRLRQK